MSPIQVERLLEVIGPMLAPKAYSNNALSFKQILLAALRFFGTGSPYFSVGDAEHLSKTAIWKCIHKVTFALNSLDNINWPSSDVEKRKIPVDFFRLSKGPKGNLPGF